MTEINLNRVIKTLLPNVKSKYTSMTYNILKNKFEEYLNNRSTPTFNIDMYNKLNPFEKYFFRMINDDWFSEDYFKIIHEFIELNERKLIDNCDVTTIKLEREIISLVSVANIKKITKELEKETVKLLEDDSWLVLRPLTWEASKKYGSGTRWCTTHVNSPEYFYRYSKGVLIYCLNKVDGNHVAVHKEINGENTLSFWSVIDLRIDSIEANLPNQIMDIIKENVFGELISNESFLTDSERERQQIKLMEWELGNRNNIEERAFPLPGLLPETRDIIAPIIPMVGRQDLLTEGEAVVNINIED